VSGNLLFIHGVFHVAAGLVDTEKGEAVEYTRVDLLSSVGDYAYDDLQKKSEAN
jgi:hypothetical protein